jgi:hypothetical protein
MPGHYRQVEAEKGNAEVELQEFDKRTKIPLNLTVKLSTDLYVEFPSTRLLPEI